MTQQKVDTRLLEQRLEKVLLEANLLPTTVADLEVLEDAFGAVWTRWMAEAEAAEEREGG